MAGFKEKVGDIYVDLGFKVDKQTKAKAEASVKNMSKNMAGMFKKGFSNLGALFMSKLGAVASVAGIIGAINNVNTNLQETVDLFDGLKTQADSIGLTFKEMQMLRAVSIFGDIPDVNQLSKGIIKFQESMGELKNGVDNPQTEYLKQMGLKGNEDTMTAFKIMLTSLNRATKSGNSAIVEQFFKSGTIGEVDENLKQFFTGGGLTAFFKAEDFYKKNPEFLLSDKKDKEIGKTDDEIKRQKIATEAQKAIDLKAKSSLEILKQQEKFKRELNKLTQDLIPILMLVVEGLDLLARAINSIIRYLPFKKYIKPATAPKYSLYDSLTGKYSVNKQKNKEIGKKE